MSIINYTYYTKDVNLEEDQVKKMANTWQAAYEKAILKKLLGHTLYTLYDADLNKEESIDTPVSDRFKALVDGADFSFDVCGNTVNTEFVGLRDSTFKKSLVGYYSYYMYRNEVESFNSGVGQKTLMAENANDADLRPKLVLIWNRMIEWYGKTPWNLINTEYFLNNGNYSHYNALPSAYNFLLANIDTYPEWVFEPLDDQNIFCI